MDKDTQVKEGAELDINDFILERVLQNNKESKIICLLGSMKGDEKNKAILKIEKPGFIEADYKNLGTKDTGLIKYEHFFHNDIFNKYWLHFKEDLSKFQSDFIYPCPERLIDKYSAQELAVVRETPEMYYKIIKPEFLDKLNPSLNEWIYQILEGKKEKELRVFENEHFMLQINFTMNSEDITSLHYLAIVMRRDLLSIRDLN